MQNKKIIYPKKITSKQKRPIVKNNLKIISQDDNNNSHDYGTETSSYDNEIKKEIKYPKESKSKSKENKNNIIIYPKEDNTKIIEKPKKKKYPPKKENIPNKSKIQIILKKINKIQINTVKEENKDNDNFIYNKNPIQLYEEEIMTNLFKEEINNRPDYSIFPGINDKNRNNILSFLKRFSFINLFISFQHELYLHQETLFLSINIFDRYIQKITLDNKIYEDLNKVALTCIWIASKYEEIYPPYLQEFIDIFRIKYTKREIFLKEDEILSSIDFQLLTISSILFLKIFSKNSIVYQDIYMKNEMDLCFYAAQFFLETCIVEPKFCELKPSFQAAICLYLARKFFIHNINNKSKIWTYELEFRTNYSEIQIKKYLKIVLNTIKNFYGNVYTKNFMAIPLYTKYSTHEYSSIAYKLKQIIIKE